MRSWLRTFLPLVLIALLLGGASVSAYRAEEQRNDEVENDVKYVPHPEALKILSAGYADLMSDFYWIRAVTYYGEWRQGDHGMLFFQELVNTTITLDPHFTGAYRFGAIVLASDMGLMEPALDLLKRGMEEMPDEWWLPFEAGFLEYTVRFDNDAAYRWFKRAGEMPSAPERPRRFAAFVASRAGHLEISYELWRVVAETTDSPDMRRKAIEYMEQLEAAIEGEGPVPEWAIPRGKSRVRWESGAGDA